MPRHKRPPDPRLHIAREYLEEHMPDAREARLTIRQLDGPPESPRFVVTAEACLTADCPYAVPREVADAGDCPILECDHRCTARVLMDRKGEVIHVTRSGVHYGNEAGHH